MADEEISADETGEAENVVQAHPFFDGRMIRCIFLAFVGACLIGGMLSVSIEFWESGPRNFSNVIWGGEEPEPEPELQDLVSSWLEKQVRYTEWSVPLVLVMGLPLFFCWVWMSSRNATYRELQINVLVCAVATGLFMLFLAGADNVRRDLAGSLRITLLIVVMFAACGSWIAWQAWRSVYIEEKFWPRFSLGTLMLIVIGWGALMAVFAPK